MRTLLTTPAMDGDGKKVPNCDIELSHVTFAYNQEDVIKDVSCKIPQGSVTALVGPSGSGKSTISKPVSYTHLDVYKRQLLYHMDQLTQINGCDLKYFDKKQIQTTKAIREYLISHLDEKVSLEQLAKEAHLNLSVFHLVFSHIYGDTPYAYLKKYKMNLAAQWLSKDKMKIGDIALELGYSNASKFAKAFQSVYGMLPKDYRKNK